MSDNRREACRTYVEQTKLLVTLASAFILAPSAAVALLRPSTGIALTSLEWNLLVWAQALVIFSVLLGYAVLGSVVGSQHDGSFDAFRPATRVLSLAQLALYLGGVIVLSCLIGSMASSDRISLPAPPTLSLPPA
jgi:hypothetical protein